MANRILRAKTNGGLKATELTEGESLYYDIEADPGNAAAASALDGTELVTVEQSGSPVKTTAQDIADLGGGGGSSTWVNYFSDITATPSSTSTIATTSDLTGEILPGMPCAYKNSGTWHYGQVIAITSILITIRGYQLTASTDWITDFAVNPDMSQLVTVRRHYPDLYIVGCSGEILEHGAADESLVGLYHHTVLSSGANYHAPYTGGAETSLDKQNAGNNIYWPFCTAQLISCQASHRRANSLGAQCTISPCCNGQSNPLSAAITLSTAWTRVSGGLVVSKTYAQIGYGQEFNIKRNSCHTYADESDLFVETNFVLETAGLAS